MLLESNVKLGDDKRAKNSKYLRMKQSKAAPSKRGDLAQDKSITPNSDSSNTGDILTDYNQVVTVSSIKGLRCQKKPAEFKFNFPIPESSLTAENLLTQPNAHSSNNINVKNKNEAELNSLSYQPSDNTFRFNFDVT